MTFSYFRYEQQWVSRQMKFHSTFLGQLNFSFFYLLRQTCGIAHLKVFFYPLKSCLYPVSWYVHEKVYIVVVSDGGGGFFSSVFLFVAFVVVFTTFIWRLWESVWSCESKYNCQGLFVDGIVVGLRGLRSWFKVVDFFRYVYVTFK